MVVGTCYLIISVFDLLGLGVLFVFFKQYLFGGDEFLIFGRSFSPVSVLWVLPLIWVLKFCFVLVANYFIVTYSHSVSAALRVRIVDELFHLPYPSSKSSEKAVWLDTLNRQLGNMATGIIEPTLRGLLDFILIILICAYMTYLAPVVFVVFGLFVILGVVAFDQVVRRPIKQFGHHFNRFSEALTLDLTKLIEGLPEFWSLRAHRIFRKRVLSNSNSIASNYTRFSLLSMSPRLFLESLLVIGLCALIIFFETFLFDRELLITSLAIIGVGSLRLVPLLNSVNLGLNQLRGAQRTLTNLGNFLPVADKRTDSAISGKIVQLKAINVIKKFGRDPVFDGINLDCSIGRATVIVGQSGCGKTTLCETLAGLLPVDEGRVIALEEGGSETQIEEAQHRIGFVTQRPIMFEGTIEENLLLGHDAVRSCSSFSLDEALNFSGFGEVLQNFGDGLDTVIGDTARKMSGGQQQKLAICRSLLLNQGVVIFDEPTSALDSEAEKQFFSMIERIKQRVIVIVVTHSKAYLNSFDTVVEFADGHVEIKNLNVEV